MNVRQLLKSDEDKAIAGIEVAVVAIMLVWLLGGATQWALGCMEALWIAACQGSPLAFLFDIVF